jgi:hypothetical protein
LLNPDFHAAISTLPYHHHYYTPVGVVTSTAKARLYWFKMWRRSGSSANSISVPSMKALPRLPAVMTVWYTGGLVLVFLTLI